MFKAKGIYKAYRKRAILRGIDFEAEENRICDDSEVVICS